MACSWPPYEAQQKLVLGRDTCSIVLRGEEQSWSSAHQTNSRRYSRQIEVRSLRICCRIVVELIETLVTRSLVLMSRKFDQCEHSAAFCEFSFFSIPFTVTLTRSKLTAIMILSDLYTDCWSMMIPSEQIKASLSISVDMGVEMDQNFGRRKSNSWYKTHAGLGKTEFRRVHQPCKLSDKTLKHCFYAIFYSHTVLGIIDSWFSQASCANSHDSFIDR